MKNLKESCYASSYPSGMSEEVVKWIKEIYGDVKIIFNFDGLVVYQISKELQNVPFINNTFLVLGYKKCSGKNYNLDIENFLNSINFDLSSLKELVIDNGLIKTAKQNNQTFKILTLDKNQPIKVDYNLLKPLEKEITNYTGFKLGEKQHDIDFILTRRSENIIFLMVKLTYNRKTEKNLAQGSLRPEITNIMCRLAEIKETDICMDMFCGSGSIPKEIIKNFKYNMVFASDIVEEKVNKLKKEFKNNNKKLYIKQRDALNLDYFENEFIDKIITDPPWNIFEKQDVDFTEFYIKFLKEAVRILKQGGKAVILMGNTFNFENALKNIANLELTKSYNLLINGKKAKIYVLEKTKNL